VVNKRLKIRPVSLPGANNPRTLLLNFPGAPAISSSVSCLPPSANSNSTMKNVTAIAIVGIALLVLVNFYFVLIDFSAIKPVTHGRKIMEVLPFLGYLALLPFFVKFHKRRLFK
jgi:hypothetical protein